MFRILFLISSVFCISNAFGATCTTTTRTNYSTGQVLTSSALNTDFNQLVSKVNSLDGGCVTDGTLEASALNSSQFSAVTNGIHEGCGLAYSDANTVSVGKCIASVNGSFIKTSVANTVTWACSGCSSEASSTTFYVYAKSGSTGTTLNLLISTSAPGVDGYDGSGNKILGRFFNNSSSNIDQYSVESWTGNGYVTTNAVASVIGATRGVDIFSFGFGNGALTACSSSPCSINNQVGSAVTGMTRSGNGSYAVALARTYTTLLCTGSFQTASGVGHMKPLVGGSASLTIVTVDNSNALTDTWGTVYCLGY